jgi:hypothetical protein
MHEMVDGYAGQKSLATFASGGESSPKNVEPMMMRRKTTGRTKCMYDVTLWRVHETSVAVEKQEVLNIYVSNRVCGCARM